MPRKLLLASNLKGLDIFWDPDTVSIGHVDRKGAVGAEGAVGCDDAVVWAKVQFGRLGAEVLHGEETRGEVQ